MRRFVVRRIAALVGLLALLYSTGVAAAPTTGYPRQVLWIILAGSTTEEVRGDVEALVRTHEHLGNAPGLLTVLAPPDTLLPRDEGVVVASPADLADTLATDGPVLQRARKDGLFDRPQLLVVLVASHGAADGATQWGNRELPAAELAAILERARALFQVPTIVLLDKCHAGASEALLQRLDPPTRAGLFVISASTAGGLAFTRTWSQAWAEVDRVWPTVAQRSQAFEAPLKKIFVPRAVYSEMTLDLVLAQLGAAADTRLDGLDAPDLCDFLARSARERRRGDPLRSDPIRCPPSVEAAPELALTTTRLRIALNGSHEPSLAALRGALKAVVRDLGVDPWVDVCALDMTCPQADWRCTVQPRSDGRWSTLCRDSQQTSVIVDTPAATPDGLIAGFPDLARKVLRPAWHPQTLHGAGPPKVSRSASGDHVVLIDQSRSMRAADPDGRKRLLFFDAVLDPLLRSGNIRRLELVRFSDRNTLTHCLPAGQTPVIAAVRDCYRRSLGDLGATEFSQTLGYAAELVTPGVSVWLVSDAEQTRTPLACQRDCQQHLAFTTCSRRADLASGALETAAGFETLCAIDPARSDTAKYYQCVRDTLECSRDTLTRAARRVTDAGGRIHGVFFRGPGTPADFDPSGALGLAADPRDITILPDHDLEKLYPQLAALAARASATTNQVISTSEPACRSAVDGTRCTLILQRVPLAPYQRDVTVYFGPTAVAAVAVRLKLVSTDAILATTPGMFAIKSLASHEDSLTHPAGFTIDVTRSPSLTTLRWTPTTQRWFTSEWEIELEYTLSPGAP